MEISDSIQIMKALADSSRLMILNSLMEKSQYVEELSERLRLAASTVSFHLKKLENAQLVRKTKEQYYVVYHINDHLLELSLRDLTAFRNIEKFIQQERLDNYRNKVIETFFKDRKLLRIPSQKKKRMIILEEFARMFDNGRRYSESEVNDIITESYEDYCTIRRYLIDEGIMQRENQVYWLTHGDVLTDSR
ncbi:MAG: metalloregulator ArsR/SmtB family transcription factor [Calditrichia bacterium]